MTTNQILREWLDKHNFNDVEVVETEGGFLYDSDGIIYWNPLTSLNSGDIAYDKMVEKLGLKVDCGSFLISFFHELGHHVTLLNIPHWKVRLCELYQKFLEEKPTPIFMWQLNLYFLTIREYKATRWAIKYINNHAKDIMRLKAKLEKATD